MIAVSKLVYILSCGFVLGVGLLDQTAWAEKDGMRISQSTQRIGGQAGGSYSHVKQQQASIRAEKRTNGEAEARIGGQAGKPFDHITHEYESVRAGDRNGQAKARIGGQAGEGYGPIELEN